MIPREIEAVAGLGWRVYPCSRTSRAGAYKGAHLAATDDLNQIAEWCREYSGCNWRVVFGPSRLWALDLDVPPGHAHDGIAAMTELVKVHGPLPPRPQARSGGGGLGLFFRHDGEKILGQGGVPAPGIDPRRGMQSQTIPPSVHIVTRRPYQWITPPWRVAPPSAPSWLLRLVEPPPEPEYRRVREEIVSNDQARRRMFRIAMAMCDAPMGGRNEALNRHAYYMGRMIGAGLLDEREAAETLYGAARSAGLEHAEIRATIHSGFLSGRKNPMREGASG